jgi:hypothetical protein
VPCSYVVVFVCFLSHSRCIIFPVIGIVSCRILGVLYFRLLLCFLSHSRFIIFPVIGIVSCRILGLLYFRLLLLFPVAF